MKTRETMKRVSKIAYIKTGIERRVIISWANIILIMASRPK